MLSLSLLCVGRAKLGAERDLSERYIERATRAARPLGLSLSLQELGESSARRAADRRAEEARALHAALPAGATLVAFDERGRAATSREVAGLVQRARDTGVGMGFVIGGPDGLDASLREGAAHVIALGAMTWPHQLARIMVAEQIYRALTILGGHPYHRD